MILVVSFPDNPHVEAVVRHLRVPYAVVDVADFPVASALSVATDVTGTSMAWRLRDGRVLDLADVGAVWYRRLRPLGLADGLDDTGRLFAWSESTEALLGMWHSLDAWWMNSPLAEEAAQRKVLQLRVAVEVGLEVPDTLVTNDPAVARAFVERVGPGRVVRKAFRNIPEAPRETAVVGPEHLDRLDLVRHAPVIFQEYVPAVVDLRVTVVDGEVLAAQITSDADHQVDYRLGLGTADVAPHVLPDTVADGLRALMARLGVTYGAIDLRLTPDGRYVFLEINPAGEFLFASERAGLPVPEAIAAALTRADARRGSQPGEGHLDPAAGGHVVGVHGHGDGREGVPRGDLAVAGHVEVGAQRVVGPLLQPLRVDGQPHGHLAGLLGVVEAGDDVGGVDVDGRDRRGGDVLPAGVGEDHPKPWTRVPAMPWGASWSCCG
ncbi:MvdC/MvdD family ATP grasp protein [Aquipuribacter sp. SD81]|uniref:MvdC/MvdD family ATP grasp protein n=1 Tax=Aquipuribacter sp. SD81 TaxID=3127703 RepID=UPI003018F841